MIAISRFFSRQGRAGQIEFLSDATSPACLADGRQPQGPPPFFPGGAASERRPGLSGTRETRVAPRSPFVSEVERRLSLVDELETAVTANLRRAELLRQAILKRAFEGKLVPHHSRDE